MQKRLHMFKCREKSIKHNKWNVSGKKCKVCGKQRSFTCSVRVKSEKQRIVGSGSRKCIAKIFFFTSAKANLLKTCSLETHLSWGFFISLRHRFDSDINNRFHSQTKAFSMIFHDFIDASFGWKTSWIRLKIGVSSTANL